MHHILLKDSPIYKMEVIKITYSNIEKIKFEDNIHLKLFTVYALL